MINSPVSAFNETLQKTHVWLKELMDLGSLENEQQAYSVLRAVLHALRDRLTVDEAVHLAAELPMLVRGFYYEGWKPAKVPNKERSREQFLESVREGLRPSPHQTIDIEKAAGAVFQLIENKISQGEINDIRRMMSSELLKLWD